MSADWPYDDPDPLDEPPRPSWDCPEGLCECCQQDEEEDVEFRVLLCTHEGERMPNARCRVHLHGRVVNEDRPNADGDGWLTVTLPHSPETVFLEWAPVDTPPAPYYPYRKHYYVKLRHGQEATRRMLHNLGFYSQSTLAENIKDFQRSYGYEIDGQLENVPPPRLRRYHAKGPPVTPDHGDSPPAEDEATWTDDASPSPAAQQTAFVDEDAAPGEALDVHHVDNDEGGEADADTDADADADAEEQPEDDEGASKVLAELPSPTEVVGWKQHIYKYYRVYSEHRTKAGTYKATFWVFNDAMKWRVPRKGKWSVWYTYPQAPDPSGDPDMLCRLPCSAKQAEQTASLLESRRLRSDLFGCTAPPCHENRSDCNDSCVRPLLLLTPKLLDLRWEQARTAARQPNKPGINGQFDPCPQNIKAPILGESAKLCFCVNNQVIQRQAQAGVGYTPNVIADSGKIWALMRRMGRKITKVVTDRDGNPVIDPNTQQPRTYTYRGAVNYGWHVSPSSKKPFKTSPAVTPGQRVIQPAAMAHDARHRDYSQLVILIAGWCEVTFPGESTPVWLETEKVYRGIGRGNKADPELCHLVTFDGKPLKKTHYDW